MKKVAIFLGNVARSVERLEQVTHYYFITSVMVMLVFGVFGSGTLIKLLIAKETTRQQLVQLNIRLESKVLELQKLAPLASKYRVALPQVDAYLPDGSNVQNVVAELAQAAARSGFIMSRATSPDASEGYTELSVLLEGTGNIVDVVSQIEELKETVEILKVDVWNDRGTQQVAVRLKVYTYQ